MQKKLTRAVAILALVCAILAFWLFKVYAGHKAYTDEPNYTIYIEEDGKAQIDVRSINLVKQKADGTLIIEGEGEQ